MRPRSDREIAAQIGTVDMAWLEQRIKQSPEAAAKVKRKVKAYFRRKSKASSASAPSPTAGQVNSWFRPSPSKRDAPPTELAKRVAEQGLADAEALEGEASPRQIASMKAEALANAAEAYKRAAATAAPAPASPGLFWTSPGKTATPVKSPVVYSRPKVSPGSSPHGSPPHASPLARPVDGASPPPPPPRPCRDGAETLPPSIAAHETSRTPAQKSPTPIASQAAWLAKVESDAAAAATHAAALAPEGESLRDQSPSDAAIRARAAWLTSEGLTKEEDAVAAATTLFLTPQVSDGSQPNEHDQEPWFVTAAALHASAEAAAASSVKAMVADLEASFEVQRAAGQTLEYDDRYAPSALLLAATAFATTTLSRAHETICEMARGGSVARARVVLPSSAAVLLLAVAAAWYAHAVAAAAAAAEQEAAEAARAFFAAERAAALAEGAYTPAVLGTSATAVALAALRAGWAWAGPGASDAATPPAEAGAWVREQQAGGSPGSPSRLRRA